MSVPAINIPARVRFGLYIAAAVALILVDYLMVKGWATAAEVGLVTKLGALATALAAAKTDLTEPNHRPARPAE